MTDDYRDNMDAVTTEDEIKEQATGEQEIKDPLAMDDEVEETKKRLLKLKKLDRRFKLLRVDDIAGADHKYNQEDTRKVLSTYIPARKARLLGRALLRLDKMRLFLLGSLLMIAVLFILAFMQEKMGNFTINLDRLELFRKGIAMSADPEFTVPTAKLVASHVEDATNISIDDLPFDIAEVDGAHNGRNYMAYTYYVRNAGKEDVDYVAQITLDSKSKGAQEAVRVAVWRDGVRTVYAWPSKSGEPEPGCVNFESPKVVCSIEEGGFKVGYVNKYTVAIWMEGDDPECMDDIIGGSVEFSMNIAAADKDETTLLAKFIRDIKDSITGNRPISASGTQAPDYYQYQDVNWHTRRNNPDNQEDQD